MESVKVIAVILSGVIFILKVLQNNLAYTYICIMEMLHSL